MLVMQIGRMKQKIRSLLLRVWYSVFSVRFPVGTDIYIQAELSRGVVTGTVPFVRES